MKPASELERPLIPGSHIDTIFGIMCSPASTPDDTTNTMKDFKSHSYAKSNVTTHRQNYFSCVSPNTTPSLSDKAVIKCIQQALFSELQNTCANLMLPSNLQWDKPSELSHNLSGGELHNTPVNVNTKSNILLLKHSC